MPRLTIIICLLFLGLTLAPTMLAAPPKTTPLRVVSQLPQAGSVVAPNTAIELDFNQPIQTDSVVAHLRIEPFTTGSFEWLSNRSLKFKPIEPLQQGQLYTVTLESATSETGEVLATAVTWSFKVNNIVAVEEILPANKSTQQATDTLIQVKFNQAIPNREGLNPLTFSPPITGQGVWIGADTYQFIPQAKLAPATRYRMMVKSYLGKMRLPKAYVSYFTTVAPEVVGLWPSDEMAYLKPTDAISIAFNQLMNHASVEKNFALTRRYSSIAITGTFKWVAGPTDIPYYNSRDRHYYSYYDKAGVETMVFQPHQPLKLDYSYQIKLGQALPLTGNVAIKNELYTEFQTGKLPRLVTAHRAENSIYLEFNTAMNPDSLVLGENLLVEPLNKEDFWLNWEDYNTKVYINASSPSELFTVTITGTVKSNLDYSLPISQQFTWKSDPWGPALRMQYSGRQFYNMADKTEMFITARNVSRIDFKLYRFDPVDFLTMGDYYYNNNARHPAEHELLATWSMPISPDFNQNITYRVDLGLQSGLATPKGSLPAGMYYLEAQSPSETIYKEAAKDAGPPMLDQVFFVSPYQMTLKRSQDQLLAWVTEVETGKPVRNVSVQFGYVEHDNNKKLHSLGRAKTDAAGIAMMSFEGRKFPSLDKWWHWDNPYFFALITRPDFGVVLDNDAWEVSSYDFNNVKIADDDNPLYVGHMYTERPIYRPNQTVYFKAIVRTNHDAVYQIPPTNITWTLSVMDSMGKEILRKPITLTEWGTMHDEIALDEAAPLGVYKIELATVDDFSVAQWFRVTEYRKPEFEVTVEADKANYNDGEMMHFKAESRYYSGGVVAKAKVKWTLLTSNYYFSGRARYSFNHWDDYYYSYNNHRSSEKLASGEAVTDEQGRFNLDLAADIGSRKMSQRLTLDVELEDINHQAVASSASVVAHKGQFYLGIKPENYLGEANKRNKVKLLAVDWANEAVANQPVEVIFSRRNWYSSRQQDVDERSYYWNNVLVEDVVFTASVKTNAAGEAESWFVPTESGSYVAWVISHDALGHEVAASTYIWVWRGKGYVNWGQEDNTKLALVADQESYHLGDTAKILVAHPFNEPVYALVTLERGRIYDQFVTRLESNTQLIEIPITEKMLPNMYVSVAVIKGMNRANQRLEFADLPDIKMGYVNLTVEGARELHIQLTPNKEENYRPGETVTYQIQVMNYLSQPVKAEVSVALVDKALLALQPEQTGLLASTFWYQRALDVRTWSTLKRAIAGENLEILRAKGGDGGLAVDDENTRKNFKETALWQADVHTDEQGKATVSVVLPDNLTTWTLTAKAVTGADTLVGEAKVDIVSSKALLIRPVMPRFLMAGDKAIMGMVIQNNSAEDLMVDTFFKADGLTITPLTQTQVLIKAGQRVKVDYQAEALPLHGETSTISLTFQVKSGAYQDALILPLPLQRPTVTKLVAADALRHDEQTYQRDMILPPDFAGELVVKVDFSAATSMGDGLSYLEHYPHECTEQTLSRFLPNLYTYRATNALSLNQNVALKTHLPELVNLGLQRMYNHQHLDGGWGWWMYNSSNPQLTAYVLLGLLEARRVDLNPDSTVINQAENFLQSQYIIPTTSTTTSALNQQAVVLYALSEGNLGDLGRARVLFEQHRRLSHFGKAFLALTLHHLDPKAPEIKVLLAELTRAAQEEGGGVYWPEKEHDYAAMSTDVRSTAIIISALARLQPDHELLPKAVNWLMAHRPQAGQWGTTQETAWALIGLTDWLIASGEGKVNYQWQVELNGETLQHGQVTPQTAKDGVTLLIHDTDLKATNHLSIKRGKGEGLLYYTVYLQQASTGSELETVNHGVQVYHSYWQADSDAPLTINEAKVGDIVEVHLDMIVPKPLHYAMIQDPIPAGTELVDRDLAITSLAQKRPSMTQRNHYWWYDMIDQTELHDEKVVMFANYLPAGVYQYTYYVRASIPGTFQVSPPQAEQSYAPDIFGRGTGGTFTVKE